MLSPCLPAVKVYSQNRTVVASSQMPDFDVLGVLNILVLVLFSCIAVMIPGQTRQTATEHQAKNAQASTQSSCVTMLLLKHHPCRFCAIEETVSSVGTWLPLFAMSVLPVSLFHAAMPCVFMHSSSHRKQNCKAHMCVA